MIDDTHHHPTPAGHHHPADPAPTSAAARRARHAQAEPEPQQVEVVDLLDAHGMRVSWSARLHAFVLDADAPRTVVTAPAVQAWLVAVLGQMEANRDAITTPAGREASER